MDGGGGGSWAGRLKEGRGRSRTAAPTSLGGQRWPAQGAGEAGQAAAGLDERFRWLLASGAAPGASFQGVNSSSELCFALTPRPRRSWSGWGARRCARATRRQSLRTLSWQRWGIAPALGPPLCEAALPGSSEPGRLTPCGDDSGSSMQGRRSNKAAHAWLAPAQVAACCAFWRPLLERMLPMRQRAPSSPRSLLRCRPPRASGGWSRALILTRRWRRVSPAATSRWLGEGAGSFQAPVARPAPFNTGTTCSAFPYLCAIYLALTRSKPPLPRSLPMALPQAARW